MRLIVKIAMSKNQNQNQVCSVTHLVASGDVMMDSGWKPFFVVDNLSK